MTTLYILYGIKFLYHLTYFSCLKIEKKTHTQTQNTLAIFHITTYNNVFFLLFKKNPEDMFLMIFEERNVNVREKH